MAFIYKLEHPDGTPVDPPTFRSSPATTWNVGDVLYLGSRTMRVIAKRSATEPEDDPVLVVEAAWTGGYSSGTDSPVSSFFMSFDAGSSVR